MNEKLQDLLNQYQNRLINIPEQHIAALLQEAQEEALAQAKEVIKTLMLRAILEKALPNGKLPEMDTPQPAAVVVTEPAETEQALIESEIESIRRKIAENEQLLQQIKAPPTPLPTPPQPDEATPSVETLADDQGYYVYGVTQNNLPLKGLLEKGIDPDFPLYALPYKSIQAIVSQVTLQEFGEEALKENLNDPIWLESKVRTHQIVLEAALAVGALIPMKFCTIYLSEARIAEILAQYEAEFIENLERLEGKQEYGVKVYSDLETLRRQVEQTNERVNAIQAEIVDQSNGKAYFARKKLETAIGEEVERLSDAYAQSSHDLLAACAAEARVTPLQSKEVSGRNQEMMLNGAYLVDDEKKAAFLRELENLNNQYCPSGFIYELTGPWPPYNFVTIGVEQSVADE